MAKINTMQFYLCVTLHISATAASIRFSHHATRVYNNFHLNHKFVVVESLGTLPTSAYERRLAPSRWCATETADTIYWFRSFRIIADWAWKPSHFATHPSPVASRLPTTCWLRIASNCFSKFSWLFAHFLANICIQRKVFRLTKSRVLRLAVNWSQKGSYVRSGHAWDRSTDRCNLVCVSLCITTGPEIRDICKLPISVFEASRRQGIF